ncbi:unnamed protein product [Pieris brassicae]|uniref:Odorant receptor n=1 Tax=Pieris brassicae TaxID=7116 RepID=A0A9P0TFW1_PIEBR|nr:unnamed protein product [Pieris brassicae]
MIFVVQTWGDWEAVADAVYVLFTQASLCCKIGVFHINYEGVRELCQQMNNEVFRPTCVVHERILQIRANNIKRLLLCFIGAAQMTCLAWGVAALPLFDNGSRKFPFVMWMPVKSDSSPQYEIGFLFQELTICTSAMIYYGVDSVAFSMVIFACAQMEIIMEKILSVQRVSREHVSHLYVLSIDRNCWYYSDECVSHFGTVVWGNIDKVSEASYLLFTQASVCYKTTVFMMNKNNLKKLIKFMEVGIFAPQTIGHEKFIELVEDTYHANIFFQLSGSVGIICIIGLRIVITEPSSVQFYSMLNYMLTILSQLFLYCWCGNELTSMNIQFRRSLIIAMERMKRPIIFKAGRYIPLSRPTFISIVRYYKLVKLVGELSIENSWKNFSYKALEV